MLDVITVGSATVDAFADTGIHEREHALCYPVGSKILIKKLAFYTGGGGTNTAVAFSRLGFETGYLGVIGRDNNGAMVAKELKQEDVSFLGKLSIHPTGYSLVLDSAEHERTILAYKGANDTLHYTDVPLQKLIAPWFYFSSMTGMSFQTQEKLAAYAAEKRIRIAYNPSSYQAAQGAAHLKRILAHTHILILNKEEAEMLVGTHETFRRLRSLGPKIVCITDGRNGSQAYDGTYLYSAEPHNIKITERTGAGDAFAAGFTAGIMRNKTTDAALQMGVAESESVIQYYGAKNKLLTETAMRKIIAQNPAAIRRQRL